MTGGPPQNHPGRQEAPGAALQDCRTVLVSTAMTGTDSTVGALLPLADVLCTSAARDGHLSHLAAVRAGRADKRKTRTWFPHHNYLPGRPMRPENITAATGLLVLDVDDILPPDSGPHPVGGGTARHPAADDLRDCEHVVQVGESVRGHGLWVLLAVAPWDNDGGYRAAHDACARIVGEVLAGRGRIDPSARKSHRKQFLGAPLDPAWKDEQWPAAPVPWEPPPETEPTPRTRQPESDRLPIYRRWSDLSLQRLQAAVTGERNTTAYGALRDIGRLYGAGEGTAEFERRRDAALTACHANGAIADGSVTARQIEGWLTAGEEDQPPVMVRQQDGRPRPPDPPTPAHSDEPAKAAADVLAAAADGWTLAPDCEAWAASPTLAAVRAAALAAGVSPMAVLGPLLAGAAARSPHVRADIGGPEPATVSIWTVGVGPSGSGKSQGAAAARRLLDAAHGKLDDMPQIPLAGGVTSVAASNNTPAADGCEAPSAVRLPGVRSAEGIHDAYIVHVQITGGKSHWRAVPGSAVLAEFDEGRAFPSGWSDTARRARDNLLGPLCTMISGQQSGAATSKRAGGGERPTLEAQCHTLALSMNAQWAPAAELAADTDGSLQRITWFAVAPGPWADTLDAAEAAPSPAVAALPPRAARWRPEIAVDGDGARHGEQPWRLLPVRLPGPAKAAVQELRRLGRRGGLKTEEAHLALNWAKAAVLLAALDDDVEPEPDTDIALPSGRGVLVGPTAWRAAAAVMAASLAVLADVRAEQRTRRRAADKAIGESAGERKVAEAGKFADAVELRVRRRAEDIAGKLDPGQRYTQTDITKRMIGGSFHKRVGMRKGAAGAAVVQHLVEMGRLEADGDGYIAVSRPAAQTLRDGCK